MNKIIKKFWSYITKLLSYGFGKFAEFEFPNILNQIIIKCYIKIFKINLDEVNLNLKDFTCLQKFFTRELKNGVRPIHGDLVSPVDGNIRDMGSIVNNRINQIKDKDYSVNDLINYGLFFEDFKPSTYLNFYLSPKDYHHIHSPLEAEIVGISYIPGALFPVNNFGLKNINNLFCQNERLGIFLNSDKFGRVILVMVGAYNVGKLEVDFECESFIDMEQGSFVNTSKEATDFYSRKYEPELEVRAGDKIGTFNLGSSVVLIFENSDIQLNKDIIGNIKYGHSII